MPTECFLEAFLEGTVILIKDVNRPSHLDNVIICKNSLLVEGITKSLISIPALDSKYSFSFEGGHCQIKSPPIKSNKGKRSLIYDIQKAAGTDNLYHLPFYTVSELDLDDKVVLEDNDGDVATAHAASVSGRESKLTIDLAHIIYNHAHEKVLTKLFPHLQGQKLAFCEACALGGLQNKAYSKKTNYDNLTNAKDVKIYTPIHDLEMGVLDANPDLAASIAVEVEPLSGRKTKENQLPLSDMAVDGFTSPHRSVRNIKYVYVLVDTVTKVCYPFLVENKSDFKSEYTKWAKHIFNKTGRFPAYLRVDQGGEITSGDMKKFFGECGTKATASTTGQSNQNAFAERLIGILWRKTKILLVQCGLPFSYWCYAFAHVAIVYNHTPNRAIGFKRPVDVAGMMPVSSLIYPFGCEVFYFLNINDKSQVTGHRGIYLGFDDFKRGYCFLDLTTRKVVSSRTAKFKPLSFPFLFANKGIPLPLDVISWPQPSQLRQAGEKGQVCTLPPNTISLPPSSLETIDLTWDEFFEPQNKVFDGAVGSHLPPTMHAPKPSPPRLSAPFVPQAPKMVTPVLSPVVRGDDISGVSPPVFSPPFLPTVVERGPPEETEFKIGNKPAYEVERVVGHRKRGRGMQYLVKWKGFDSPQNTWEPRGGLAGCDHAVEKYFSSLDTKKALTEDFENISGLDSSCKGRVLAKFSEPLLPRSTTATGDCPLPNTQLGQSQDLGEPTPDRKNDWDTDMTQTKERYALDVPITNDVFTDQTLNLVNPSLMEAHQAKIDEVEPPPDYSGHVMFTPDDIDLNEVISYAFQTESGEDLFAKILRRERDDDLMKKPPSSQAEMLGGCDVNEYIEAEERELTGIMKHGTWEVVVRPTHRRPITCRWCYDLKRNDKNEIILHKARLVVHGFKQIEGVDFTKTFSSTAQMRTFRTIVMLSEAYNLRCTQYDISNAFLNGDLDEEIYMEYPPGYPGEPGTCLKLLKGLYGLKQAARIWNRALTKVLGKAGLKICKTEPGILYHPKITCYVCTHVDDIVVATDNEELRQKIVQLLESNFLTKSLGELTHFVGIQVVREHGKTTLKQTAYAERVYARFQEFVEKNKRKISANTPNLTDKLSKLDVPLDGTDDVLDYPFPSVVGSLMYLVVSTRPDLMHPVTQLARFMAGWGDTHIEGANKALSYLRRTSNDGIVYTRDPNFDGKLKILVFSDSDWAGCPDTRRSTLGYVIVVCGGPISWKSRLCRTLAHSSCEAEFMALSEVGKEVIWLCNFFDEIGVKYHTPKIYCDSSSAINWGEDPIQHQRTKHVEIDYYYIRDIVASRKVRLFKIDTKNNPADMFTKNVDLKTFNYLRPFVMGWREVAL